MSGHTKSVFSVAFVHGEILASGSGDNTIKIWNITDGQLIRTLNGHNRPVNCVALGGGNILASGSADYKVKLWKID